MAYTPPTTFVDGTNLTAANAEGNTEALRVYLHGQIAAGDVSNTKWIETRHVQPPTFDPIRGLQHGVTGHQGGQWAGGVNIRLQFATKYLSGNGRPNNETFHPFPQTAITFDVRQPAFCLFHYWFELENGKDESTAAYQIASAQRRVYIVPYTGDFNSSNAYAQRARGQETRNVAFGLSNSYPLGIDRPFVLTGGYGAKQGTFMLNRNTPAQTTFGLAVHSLSDRCGLVNWGIALEAWYF